MNSPYDYMLCVSKDNLILIGEMGISTIKFGAERRYDVVGENI
jgi:hypothetical protein